ncbi:MAG: hypothetical protein QNJ92_06815 [Alphaproteobacteria bacterium]|nr:hypothetical protein [Alphaproteobacteria bacterium]
MPLRFRHIRIGTHTRVAVFEISKRGGIVNPAGHLTVTNAAWENEIRPAAEATGVQVLGWDESADQ